MLPKIQVWPSHWAGGINGIHVDGHNTIRLEVVNGSEIARFPTENGEVTPAMYDRAREMAVACNNFRGLQGIVEDIQVALRYPRGSEAQVRCLEEIGEDAKYALAQIQKELQKC